VSDPTLTEFLLARIAEDEAVARALSYSPRWIMAHDMPDAFPGVVEQIMRWDPARVLAECAAKRRIVEIHAVEHLEKVVYDYSAGKYLDARVPWDVCSICIDLDYTDDEGAVAPLDYPCPTIGALAAVYAEHADYRPEWAACIKTDPPPSLQ
jgi:hypothetical protein